jgi:hypothetical protein
LDSCWSSTIFVPPYHLFLFFVIIILSHSTEQICQGEQHENYEEKKKQKITINTKKNLSFFKYLHEHHHCAFSFVTKWINSSAPHHKMHINVSQSDKWKKGNELIVLEYVDDTLVKFCFNLDGWLMLNIWIEKTFLDNTF